jgi:phosphohistidine phosphatase SixA
MSVVSYSQDTGNITTIILVRHAEKIEDGSKNPKLTSEGETRAEKLKTKFEKAGISAIYSSPYHRTMNTVKPLSETLGLEIQEYNPSGKDFIQAIYKSNIGKTIIVSGHSNTTPTAVNSLLNEERYENIEHNEYGRIFIVTIVDSDKKGVLEIQY